MGVIKLKDILREAISFTNWVLPSTDDLRREYKVEHEMKGLRYFNSEEEFLNACKNAEHLVVTPSINMRISNRSNTRSFDSLLGLIKQYRSYPKYRNEETLKAIYAGFEENRPMAMPIVLKRKDGSMRVFAGNTRMDIAFQLGISPKVLLVSVED